MWCKTDLELFVHVIEVILLQFDAIVTQVWANNGEGDYLPFKFASK